MTSTEAIAPWPPHAGDEAPAESVSGAAERTLRLLSILAEEGRPMSLMELANQLVLPKGTVHRLCMNLVSGGFLIRDVDERAFGVGPAMRSLAFNTLNHGTLRGMRHSVLRALVADIGETCNFTTLDGTEVIYLDRVEAKRPLRLTIDVGSHVPIHCTSSGKLLLAHMNKRRRDAVIERMPLPRLTNTTITSRDRLREECDEIVARGYSADREEFVEGLISVAVPVFDSERVVRATVSVHAPAVRLSLDVAVARIDLLRSAADQMGRLI